MSKEVMRQALEALEYTTTVANFLLSNEKDIGPMLKAREAITALQESIAKRDFWEGYVPEPVKPAQPYKGIADHTNQVTNGRMRIDPVTGDVGIGTPSQQPAQQEPVAGQPLPCPFCGHIGLDFADGETYRWGVASCGGCGASCGDVRRQYPDKGEWHTEAIAEWNRRSPAAQRTWVGLTDEEVTKMPAWIYSPDQDGMTAEEGLETFARAIESKLKEKNT